VSDSQTWYPEDAAPDYTYAYARRICQSCPVRVECLDYAMAREPASRASRHGMWGGLTPTERARLGKPVAVVA
jgi:WhiB family transcriptional regulator, redox-sensing transcriptional regulator